MNIIKGALTVIILFVIFHYTGKYVERLVVFIDRKYFCDNEYQIPLDTKDTPQFLFGLLGWGVLLLVTVLLQCIGWIVSSI